MSPVLSGADIRGYYAELGIQLPAWARAEAAARCFAAAGSHQHADSDPSVSVNLISGAWRCHGGGAKGRAYGAALAVGHNPQSAIDTMIRHGLITRRARLRTARELLNTPTARRPPTARSPRRQGGRRAVDVTETAIQPMATPAPAQPYAARQAPARALLATGSDPRASARAGSQPDHDPDPRSHGRLQGVLRYQPPPRDTLHMFALAGSRLGLIPHPAAETSTSVLLVEGPPDRIAARSHRLTRHRKLQPTWAKLLADRHVTIVMDADKQGRAAAQRISDDLTTVADAQIVDLSPSRADGFDLTDWILDRCSNDTEELG